MEREKMWHPFKSSHGKYACHWAIIICASGREWGGTGPQNMGGWGEECMLYNKVLTLEDFVSRGHFRRRWKKKKESWRKRQANRREGRQAKFMIVKCISNFKPPSISSIFLFIYLFLSPLSKRRQRQRQRRRRKASLGEENKHEQKQSKGGGSIHRSIYQSVDLHHHVLLELFRLVFNLDVCKCDQVYCHIVNGKQ